MVARQPAGSDWLVRYLPLLVSTLLGLFSAGIVFYFSSKAVELGELRTEVTATREAVAVMKSEMALRQVARDAQVLDLTERVTALDHRGRRER